ncbi:autotransporter domain-containing protein [Candidatus Pelagibacter sp.]|nr:autotransporter domain-containing protein [Candidatus Pelagibacter sp.]
MKLINKITFIIIFLLVNINAFGAVSGFVDSKQVNQNIPMAIAFNPSGTKMFVVGMSQNKIFEFDLTTGFDVSTATKNSNVCSFIGLADDAVDIDFNSDGTKLFLVDVDGTEDDEHAIEEFNLTTAYDVSTCVHANEHFLDEFKLVGIEFNASGTKLFIFDETGGSSLIKQYSLNSPYNLSNPTLQKQSTGTIDKTYEAIEDSPKGFAFSSDGSKMFMTGRERDKVQEFNLSTPFDLSSVSKTDAYGISGQIDDVGGISFSNDGLKMFVLDADNDAANKDVNEYNLTCGFGVINCIDPTANKDDVASIETQSESAKKLIQHTTYPVINRMQWLRRNNSRGNLTNQNIKFQFNNEILNSLSKTLLPVYLSNYNSSNTDNENSSWSLWSEGTISVGRIGDTSASSSKKINTSAITLGADKRGKDNIMRGIALRFGSDDVDVGDLGSALNMSTFGLTFYETKPKGEERFTDHLLGLSFINSDLINNSGSTSTNGERSGEQIYGSYSLRDTFSKNNLNFTPKIKIDYGVTHFAEYTETGATGLNLKFKDQYIGNFITSVGANIDKKFDLKDKSFLPYFDFIYSADMSPSTKQKFSYASSGDKYTLDNINNATHSVHTGIGFDLITDSGFNLMTKYTRDQTTGGSYNDNFVIAGDYRASHNSSYALSVHETSTEISYKSKRDNLNFDVTSNLDFFAEDPEYGIYLKVYTLK